MQGLSLSCTTLFFISFLSAELGLMVWTPLHKEWGTEVGHKMFAVLSPLCLTPKPYVPVGDSQPAEQQHQFALSSISQPSADESVCRVRKAYVSEPKQEGAQLHSSSLHLVVLYTTCLSFPQIALSPFHSPPAFFACLPCSALAMEIVMISLQLIPFHTPLPPHTPRPFASIRSCWGGLGLSALFRGVPLGQTLWSSCNREALCPTQNSIHARKIQ